MEKKIKTNIINITEAVGIRKVNMNGSNNIKPWFTEEVKTLAKEKRETYLQYKSNRSQEQEHNRYKEIRNRANNEKSEKRILGEVL